MLGNWDLSMVRFAIVQMIALILSIAVHEFGHAFVADRLGDRLPRSQGRVTLNPIAHIDPIGTLLLPIMGIVLHTGIIGWGRPVQISPVSFTRKLRMKTGHLLVAAAGPFMNIVFGVVVTMVGLLVQRFGIVHNPDVLQSIYWVVELNFILAFFNLLPVPPLDGGAVLAGMLSDRNPVVELLEKYGFYLLIFLVVVPKVLPFYFGHTAEPLLRLWFHLVGVL